MNQPTEDRIKRLEEEQRQLREEFRQFKEQRTEEIKVTRVEVASADVLTQLKALEQGQQETTKRLDIVQEDTNRVTIQMEGARADIGIVKANQSDLKEYLTEQFKSIEDKQDAHSELLGQLINVGENHTGRFDRIDANIAELRTTQSEHGDMLKLILAELRKPRRE